MAATVSETTHSLSFNPSWMRSAFHGSANSGGGGPQRQMSATGEGEAGKDYPLAPAVMAKNRYGREELLALMTPDGPPPDGIEQCAFYLEQAQRPIVLQDFTDVEVRLQHNINSSKAMSSIAHAERERGTAGPAGGAPFAPNWMERNGPTPRSDRGFAPTRGGGGGFPFRAGRGGMVGGAGVGGGAGSGGPPPPVGLENGPGRYVPSRGRGGAVNGRGGGAVGAFNPRAQGLYDPRDPRDRPRQRLRSTSEDGAPPTAPPQGWEDRRRPGFNRPSADGMPEWMDDGEEEETKEDEDAAGSFDDLGQFKPLPDRSADKRETPVKAPPSTTPVKSAEPATKTTPVEGGNAWTARAANQRELKEASNALASETPPRQTSSNNKNNSNSNNEHRQASLAERGRSDSEEAFAHVERSALSLVDSLSEDDPAPQPQRQKHRPQLMTQTSAPPPQALPPQQQQQQQQQKQQQHHLPVSQPNTPQPVQPSELEMWQYRDPKGAVRGPFDAQQMHSWFVAGYFTMDLMVQRIGERDFTPLGDLIRRFGGVPFAPKSQASTPMASPAVQASNTAPKLATMMGAQVRPAAQARFAVGNRSPGPSIWGDVNDQSVADLNPLMEALKVQQERQRLVEEQRRVAEEQLKLQQIQEGLLREKEERERLMRERELELQRRQDEIQRQHAIEREKVAVRERELEAERQRIVSDQERMRQVALEEERKRIEVEIRAKHAAEVERQKKEVQRIEEESRRLHARKQQEMEVEMQRIEEEARQRQILIERQRQMDQQDMRERIQQQQLQLQQQQQQQLQPQEQQVRISMAELFGAATGSADSQRNNTSWQMSFPSDSNEGTPKTAPWNKTPGSPLKTPAKTTPAPSLLDIQLEEERQLKAEQRQKKQQDAHKRNNLPNAEATGVWGNSTQRLTWGQNAGTPPSVNSGPSAWGNAASKQPEPSSHGFWDADPAPAPQQPAPKKEKKKDNTKAAKSKAQKPAGNQKDSQQESVKKLFQSASTTQDPFLSWVVKRVTQLNKDVDAEVFATFIEGVESPVDVEDYIVGYLGEGRPAKDFLREFLEKRSETRARKLDTDRDDMSMPAAALTKEEQASAAAAAAIAAGNRKKKRGKGGQKLLVDGSHLGFTATSDPNRLNVGDIDTIQ